MPGSSRRTASAARGARWRRAMTVALLAAGVLASALASAVLVGADATALGLWTAVVALVAMTAAGTVIAVRRTLAADRRRPLPASGGLLGRVGVVRRPLDPVGQVAVNGELWRARCSWGAEDEDAPPQTGDAVVVERVDGLTLTVRRAEIWEVQPW